MNRILDRVAAEWRSDFRPTNPIEYFALRLASRLGEPQTARHFALLASEHGIEKLIAAFHRTVSVAVPSDNLGKRFHTELLNPHSNGVHASTSTLAGLRIERRTIGAVIFRDTRLIAARIRQLPSNPAKAEVSTIAFVHQLIREHGFESAALEETSLDEEIQRAVLTDAARTHLRENSVSIWDLNPKIVAAMYGHPPVKTRTELRKIIQGIWPQFSLHPGQASVLDAAALALFIQTERLLNNF